MFILEPWNIAIFFKSQFLVPTNFSDNTFILPSLHLLRLDVATYFNSIRDLKILIYIIIINVYSLSAKIIHLNADRI